MAVGGNGAGIDDRVYATRLDDGAVDSEKCMDRDEIRQCPCNGKDRKIGQSAHLGQLVGSSWDRKEGQKSLAIRHMFRTRTKRGRRP